MGEQTVVNRRIVNGSAETNGTSTGNKSQTYVPQLRWPDLIAQIFVHGGALYGLYLAFVHAKLGTALWGKSKVIVI